MLVCVDTSLLILTQQSAPKSGQKTLFEAARAYETWLSETDCGVLIPTPVVSEFLSSRDAKIRRQVLKSLQTFADVADFDLRAAELAARLRLRYAEKHGLPRGLDRQVLTVDMMITAIALVNRASHIITHDKADFERIVTGLDDFKISIRGVKEGPPGQGSLFGE